MLTISYVSQIPIQGIESSFADHRALTPHNELTPFPNVSFIFALADVAAR